MNSNFNNGMNGDFNRQNQNNFGNVPNQGYNWQNQQVPNGYNMPNNIHLQPEQKEKVKKGAIIAIVSVCLVLILASVLLGYSILNGDSSRIEDTTSETKNDSKETASNQTGSLNFTENSDTSNGGLSANDVYKKIYESSVGITVYGKNSDSVVSEGTGVVLGLSEDGTSTYIITCAHVIDDQKTEIVVQTADDNQHEATVVGMDLKTDIGVIRVKSTDLKPAEFADSSTLEVGDTVYAIGNPGGSHFFGSFTNGMVSAIGRPIDSPVGYEVPCVQHTAPINPGNSGGALVNSLGQVVGINSSKIADESYEGMGFSVPSTMVKQVVDELIKNGYVSNRPKLGIEFTQAKASWSYYDIVKANNLPLGAVVIESISKDSDLANTSVKAGDMIIAVNGNDLDNYEVLLDTIENGKVGETLTLTIARVDSSNNVTTFDVKVKLVEDKS